LRCAPMRGPIHRDAGLIEWGFNRRREKGSRSHRWRVVTDVDRLNDTGMAIISRACYANRASSVTGPRAVCITLLPPVSTLRAPGSARVSKRQTTASFTKRSVLSPRIPRGERKGSQREQEGASSSVFVRQKCRIVAKLRH